MQWFGPPLAGRFTTRALLRPDHLLILHHRDCLTRHLPHMRSTAASSGVRRARRRRYINRTLRHHAPGAVSLADLVLGLPDPRVQRSVLLGRHELLIALAVASTRSVRWSRMLMRHYEASEKVRTGGQVRRLVSSGRLARQGRRRARSRRSWCAAGREPATCSQAVAAKTPLGAAGERYMTRARSCRTRS